MQHSNHCEDRTDFGAEPYVINISCATAKNTFYRKAIWTGAYLQTTLMCIPSCGEIGLEIHPDNDQFLRIEQGNGMVMMGTCKENLTFRHPVHPGDAIFIPACTWHNLVNTGSGPLKLYSIYAPPHHPRGTLQKTKADADQ